ncbi:cupin domain-containing protein [Halobacteriovorax marinus]|uniref:cupin domain-containing protein n=1 Tax=Halobacteriovorax marinus TaxID=97084 RepID=UPI003A935BF5
MTVGYHPDHKILEKYATGDLGVGISLLVSAHLDHCEQCSRHVSQLTADAVNSFMEPVTDISYNLDSELDQLIGSIDTEVLNKSSVQREEDGKVTFLDKTFTLPRSMAYLASKELNWKEFGKNSRIAPVETTEEGNLYFIYLDKNEEVPQHGHEGIEYSYVAAGSYGSQSDIFNTGDFSSFDSQIIHTPKALSDDGCLVISWVEKRLNFFTGIFSPLNKIMWWYLHKA